MYHKKPFDNALDLRQLLAGLEADLARKRREQAVLRQIERFLWGVWCAGFVYMLAQ